MALLPQLWHLPWRLALDFALPPRCPGCGTIADADHLFCATCWETLDFLGGPACVQCGMPFEIDPGPGVRCGACLAHPPAFEGVHAAVRYGTIAQRLAVRLKHQRSGTARTIAFHMRRLLAAHPDALLIPVPLHRWRLWQRGYNQAALITRALARASRRPLLIDGLERIKPTPVLRAMGPAARRRAVQGAFRVPAHHRLALAGRTILLIDDVFTTGATANACASALLRAGAAKVSVCCWARVVRDIDNEDA